MCPAKPGFLTIGDQTADLCIIKPQIFVGHLLQETHAQKASGQVVVGTVHDRAPVYQEKQRCVQDRQNNLNDRKYLQDTLRKKFRKRKIAEQKIHQPEKDAGTNTDIDQDGRQIFQHGHPHARRE